MISWINGEYFMAALAYWCACLVYIYTQERKMETAKAAVISSGMLIVQVLAEWAVTHQLGFMAAEPLGLRLLKACLYILLMLIHIWLICRSSWIRACIRALFAFTAAELAWGTAMFLHYVIMRVLDVLPVLVQWGITIGVYAVIFIVLFLAERSIMHRLGLQDGSVQELIITFLTAMICYTLSNLYLVFMNNNWRDLWDKTLGNIPRMTFVLIGLFFLYGRRLWKGYLQLRHELDMINGVFEKQKGQYEQARVNAEVINQKYHDLKNQIAILKADIPAEKQQEWLGALEEQVKRIEPEKLTGNPVLDTILWEKGQFCTLHEIQLSYVLDGHLFDPIAMEDLCVVFGGALDNAVEAVMKIPDKERRLIHVKALRQQGFLVLCVENINDAPLEYADGMPLTTKEDKNGHGYGIKGIRYIAEKYGGSIAVEQEDGWFRLTVFLNPLPARE